MDILINKIVDDIVEKSIEKRKSDKTEKISEDNVDYRKEIKESTKRAIKPIIKEAIVPLIDEMRGLRGAISEVNKGIPKSIASVGNSPSASGPAGAASYSSTKSKVSVKLQEIDKKLKKLKD